MSGEAITVRVGRRRVRVSNPDKVLYRWGRSGAESGGCNASPRGAAAGPERGEAGRGGVFRKTDVVGYYTRIAPFMLPHLKDRPVSLKRFPDGGEGKAFFEKNCPSHKPDWVATHPLHEGEHGPCLCMVAERATLAWLGNLAALEIHPYLWTAAHPHTPSLMVFDLDPGPGVGLAACARVAMRVRGVLRDVGLKSWAKLSGGKGLHMAVPLNTSGPGAPTFDDTKAFARAVAVALERGDPDGVTSRMSKAERPGRVFIDWSQNDRGKTTVAVYSLRGRSVPSVSAPLIWDEVEELADGRDRTILAPEAAERAERLGDLWEGVRKLRQRLPALG